MTTFQPFRCGTVRRVLVTGTDTGVGKTRVSGLLLRHLRSGGVDAAYFKPVETGAAGGRSAEVAAVRALAGDVPAHVGVVLAEPLAPAVAAVRAGQPVDLGDLDRALERLSDRHELVLIEGAGGLRVEAAPGASMRDLARRWNAAILVVVANRLGCLNHAVLTADCARSTALPWAGWVLNEGAPEDPSDVARATNPAELLRLLGDPPLAHLRYGDA